MEFREQALAKLEEPEDLDLPVRLTRPRAWLALGALGLIVLTAAIWAYVGTMPQRVTASGIIVYPQGGFLLKSTSAGPVANVFVRPGQFVVANEPVASVLSDDGGVDVVRAGAAGQISQVLVQPGQPVAAGSTVAVAERGTGAASPLVGVLYVPSDQAAQVRNGGDVDLAVQSAPTQTYGLLRGTVISVGPAPQSQAEIAGFLGDDELAGAFAKAGPPMRVVVQLRAGKTPSGLTWSIGAGPPYPIRSRTLVTGEVHLPAIRPIDLVLP